MLDYIWALPLAVLWLNIWNEGRIKRNNEAAAAQRKQEWDELQAYIEEERHWHQYGRGKPYCFATDEQMMRTLYARMYADEDPAEVERLVERMLTMMQYEFPGFWESMIHPHSMDRRNPKRRKPDKPQILVP